MKALITGAAGFVGRSIARTLELRGWDVTGTDVLWGTGGAPNFINRGELFDLVVHAAAAGANRRAIDTEKANFPYNVMLDASMINWCIETKQRHLVYLSSAAVYPAVLQGDTAVATGRRLREFDVNTKLGHSEPFDVYGHTKAIGEKMALQAREAGVNVTIVRPFSGYGNDQSEDFPFRAFVERARRHEDPFTIWSDASQVRDWIHIDDICNAIMALIEIPDAPIVNLCTGTAMDMFGLALLCTEAAGYNPELTIDEAAPMGVRYRVGDPSLLHQFYTPRITIEEGVKMCFRLTV